MKTGKSISMSIITSKVSQINLRNENIKNKHWCFQISKIVSPKNYFGILIYICLDNIYLRYISDYWEETTN
jgi:hypothetical protein